MFLTLRNTPILLNNMKHFVLVFCCCCLLSCKYVQLQEDHLSQDEMTKVLTDMHLAEAYSTMAGRDSTHKGQVKNMDSLEHYYKDILAHYHLTPEAFDKSMNWYRSNPDQLDSVYNSMINRINSLQKSAKADTTHK
jgi:hypothetical protein